MRFRFSSIDTGSPFLNSIVIIFGCSGDSSIDFVRENTYSGGSTHGSSNNFPSEDVCNRLASVLKEVPPFYLLELEFDFFYIQLSRFYFQIPNLSKELLPQF